MAWELILVYYFYREVFVFKKEKKRKRDKIRGGILSHDGLSYLIHPNYYFLNLAMLK